jgi:hypothetical protein
LTISEWSVSPNQYRDEGSHENTKDETLIEFRVSRFRGEGGVLADTATSARNSNSGTFRVNGIHELPPAHSPAGCCCNLKRNERFEHIAKSDAVQAFRLR